MKKVIYTPTVTAFDKNQKIDLEANKRIIKHFLKSGVDGLVPLGSTGEFTAFNYEEREKLIELYADCVNGKIPIMAGTVSMDFHESIKLTNFVGELKLKGALVLMPFYFGANEQNIFDYFDTFASKTKTDIYIYNYPARTGSDVSANIILKLLKRHENIKGIKDTIGDVSHTKMLAKEILPLYPDFEIYSGFDDQFNDNIIAGGVGCISGLSNVAPDIWTSLVKAGNEKNFDDLVKYSKAIAKLMEIYSLDINFSLIFKMLLNSEGLEIEPRAIFPFDFVPEGNFQKAVQILKDARELAK